MNLSYLLLAGLLAFPAAAPVAAPPAAPDGPLADFGPHERLVTHSELDSIGVPFQETLKRVLGPSHVEEVAIPLGYEDDAGHLIWMRDFSPLYVRRHGRVEAVVPLSDRAVRRHFHAVVDGGLFLPGDDEDLLGPRIDARPLPLILEGGNVVSTGRYLILTDLILEENAEENDDDELVASGYEARTREEVLALLSSAMAIPEERILVLPRLPEEATGHADVFVLALGPNTVAVPAIHADALALTEDVDERELGLTASLFLDSISLLLRRQGLTVERLPMLPPRLLPSVTEDDEIDVVYLSPANTVLYDGPAGRYAFVPSFHDREAIPRRMIGLQKSYERRWHKLLKRHGWGSMGVEADELARYLGLLRCVSAPLPFVEELEELDDGLSPSRASLRPEVISPGRAPLVEARALAP